MAPVFDFPKILFALERRSSVVFKWGFFFWEASGIGGYKVFSHMANG